MKRAFRPRPGTYLLATAAALMVAPGLGRSAGRQAQSPIPPRVVNVTTDSQKGWLPSEALEQDARKAAVDFMSAEDGGRAHDAYARETDGQRRQESYADFAKRLQTFNAKAGRVVERRIVTVTWTKDPAAAPQPGVYAAFDLVSRFTRIDRHCGYIVLFQAPAGGPFLVTREEANYLDNATAANIERTSSKAAVDAAWDSLSAHCPGYSAAPADPQALAPLPESQGSIEYKTVAEALKDLRSRPNVTFSNRGGWVVAIDNSTTTVWSFPPSGDPAYPSAVKRMVVNTSRGAEVQTDVLCEATKAPCDNLVRSFERLNGQIGAALAGPH